MATFIYPEDVVSIPAGLATEAKQDELIAIVDNLGGSLAPNEYDQISLTYVAAGNGAGEIETVIYKLSAATVATLTLVYDANDNLVDVLRS